MTPLNIITSSVYNKHNNDIICLTETFLNSAIPSDVNRITIDGYNLIRSDHPSDLKKDGV